MTSEFKTDFKEETHMEYETELRGGCDGCFDRETEVVVDGGDKTSEGGGILVILHVSWIIKGKMGPTCIVVSEVGRGGRPP